MSLRVALFLWVSSLNFSCKNRSGPSLRSLCMLAALDVIEGAPPWGRVIDRVRVLRATPLLGSTQFIVRSRAL